MTEAVLNVGAELQRAREARGLALSEVAQQLKFAPRQLEALEQERFEQLPGGTFARGMVRSYARLLKIDPEPLVRRIAARFNAPDSGTLAARYSQPVPFSDNARRSTFVYLGLSLGVLAVGAGVGYQWYQEHRSPSVQMAAASATRSPAETPRAVPPKVASSSIPKAQPKTIETPDVETPNVETANAETPVKAALAAPKVASGVHRLVIQCDEEAWIEVKDANERMLVSSLNPKGAERIVQARGPLTLVIGNAQNVRVTNNDRPVDLQPHTKAATARFTLP